MEIAAYLFGIAFLLWASMFVIAPVLLRFKTKQSTSPGFVGVDPSALPADVSDFFSRVAEAMRGLGFGVVGPFRLEAGIDNVEAYTLFFRNTVAGDMAAAAALHSNALKLHYVEFYTELEDHRCFSTINCPEAGIYKRHPEMYSFSFPEVEHPAALYDLHRRLLWRHAPGARGLLASEGMEAIYYAHLMRKVNMAQVDNGYYYVDEGDVMRPTWKGATLGAWKLLPPVRSIRKAWLMAHGRKTMAELSRAA